MRKKAERETRSTSSQTRSIQATDDKTSSMAKEAGNTLTTSISRTHANGRSKENEYSNDLLTVTEGRVCTMQSPGHECRQEGKLELLQLQKIWTLGKELQKQENRKQNQEEQKIEIWGKWTK